MSRACGRVASEVRDAEKPRIRLSKDLVLRTAVTVADAGGVESLTMRNLAEQLGVEAMSLYYYLANKDALLDGVVDVVVDEIQELADGVGASRDPAAWKASLRRRILVAREVMLRHPWMREVLETRTTMSLTLARYFDTTLGILRDGGFTYEVGHHAMHAMGSRALGFTHEMFVPKSPDDEAADSAALEQMAGQVPHIIAMLREISHDDPNSILGWCDAQEEFEFGLDLILDGLERLRASS